MRYVFLRRVSVCAWLTVIFRKSWIQFLSLWKWRKYRNSRSNFHVFFLFVFLKRGSCSWWWWCFRVTGETHLVIYIESYVFTAQKSIFLGIAFQFYPSCNFYSPLRILEVGSWVHGWLCESQDFSSFDFSFGHGLWSSNRIVVYYVERFLWYFNLYEGISFVSWREISLLIWHF